MLCRRRCYRDFQNGDITIEEVKNKEYREGHLQGAINIPDFEIAKRILKEVPKKNQLIVLYCQYGGRSKTVSSLMQKMGYTNVYNLYGGLDML